MKQFFKWLLMIILTIGLGLLLLVQGMAFVSLLLHVGQLLSGPLLMGVLVTFVGIGVGLGLYLQRKWFRERQILSTQGFATIFGFLFTIVLVVSVIFYEPVLQAVGDYLVINQRVENKADLIWILGSADERYIHGIDLYEQGLGDRVIMTMGRRFVPKLLQTETIQTNIDVILRYVLDKGLVEGIDFFIYPAESTYDEAAQARDFLNQSNLNSIIVVSSPGHMRRVEMIFNHLIDDSKELTFVSVPLGRSDFDYQWWKDEFSQGRVIYEYLSLVFYYFRYVIF